MSINQSLLVLLALFISPGCGNDYFYQKTIPIPDQGWSYSDTLNFDFTIPDTSGIYNIFLELEHKQDYAFQNLYVQIGTYFPDGRKEEKVVSLEMADKMGYWYGECDNDWCNLIIPLQSSVYFDQAGSHQLTINQHLRVDPLKGVRSVSLKLEKTEQVRGSE